MRRRRSRVIKEWERQPLKLTAAPLTLEDEEDEAEEEEEKEEEG
jgi:hypothetical protein